MIKIHDQIVIVAYLAAKLDVDENWFETKQDFLWDCTPYEVIMRGDGDVLIKWLEERLGLSSGEAF